MEDGRERLAQLMSELEGTGGPSDLSRATSPGAEPTERNGSNNNFQVSRTRPRTYPYFRYLPYTVENEETRRNNFEEILEHLYVAVEAGDFAPGAVHWTRELRSWLGLKFDPTKEQRIKLVRLYYELSLAPGIDVATAERFASMFILIFGLV